MPAIMMPAWAHSVVRATPLHVQAGARARQQPQQLGPSSTEEGAASARSRTQTVLRVRVLGRSRMRAGQPSACCGASLLEPCWWRLRWAVVASLRCCVQSMRCM
jgi:hypothetical protein